MLAGPSTKRKRETYTEDESDNFSDVDAGSAFSDDSDEVDISSALTGKKPKRERGVRASKTRRKAEKEEPEGSSGGEDAEDDDDGLHKPQRPTSCDRDICACGCASEGLKPRFGEWTSHTCYALSVWMGHRVDCPIANSA